MHTHMYCGFLAVKLLWNSMSVNFRFSELILLSTIRNFMKISVTSRKTSIVQRNYQSMILPIYQVVAKTKCYAPTDWHFQQSVVIEFTTISMSVTKTSANECVKVKSRIVYDSPKKTLTRIFHSAPTLFQTNSQEPHPKRRTDGFFSLPVGARIQLVGQQKQNWTSCRLIYAAIFSILIFAFRLPAAFQNSHLFEFNAQLSVLRAVLLCSLFIFALFSFAWLLSDCSRGLWNIKIHTHSAQIFSIKNPTNALSIKSIKSSAL